LYVVTELAEGSTLKQRLEELRADEERATALEADARVLAERYRELARELSARRQQARLLLEDQVHAGLVQLGMPDVRLQVLVTPREAPARDGMDQVTFLFAANPGEEPRPLARVASGGELSRLILAMKKALARVYRVPTLIFDEIDVGVGGSALNAMARVLAELSTTHQVVLVTHSPQVASYADTHYLLEKRSAGGRVTTAARRLEGQEREREIARMMAGEAYSPVTLEHAREMLARARQERNR
ncbi:MAG: DNA repair protein RecN, partial [Syntrophomonadaceae bacterium]|nr:DNA repair protein RecN [Syntrophomonadaceae bacterium]